MKIPRVQRFLPDWKNAALAILSAIMLILAFPDFEFWFLAWFAMVPLFWAIEKEKASAIRCFVLGWLFGTVFFFGTCWWLTFAPITYAAFPPLLAYSLLFFVCIAVGIFPGIFAAVFSVLLRRFGSIAILSAPFIWVSTEFLRYWLTGNNWNAIGYSQSFTPIFLFLPSIGGMLLVSFAVVFLNSIWAYSFTNSVRFTKRAQKITATILPGLFMIFLLMLASYELWIPRTQQSLFRVDQPQVIAIQPNVPMSGLTQQKWQDLRERHIELAESAIRGLDESTRFAEYGFRFRDQSLPGVNRPPTAVIFPESPMNFAFEEDMEFQEFVKAFAARNNVHVLFNGAEPDRANRKYFNSAVMIDPQGTKVAQYDKIYLVPFGESVPAPLQSIVPAFVGSFSYGSEYDLFPLGDAKAGVMICFESHFGSLSREYVRNGADVLIEMTNDGYLGPTPVLRQHLANAVFRAVETNRPVLRVTNVGITAYINERGEVLEPTESYTEDTRIWSVSKSDGNQTFYVRYGDWFAWLCSIITLGLLLLGFWHRRSGIETPAISA